MFFYIFTDDAITSTYYRLPAAGVMEEENMSSNFDFVMIKESNDEDYLKIRDELYKSCTDAEDLVHSKPGPAITEIRKAAELTIKFCYLKRVGDYGKMSLNDIRIDQNFVSEIQKMIPGNKSDRFFSNFKAVQEKGNKRTHDSIDNPYTTALGNLRKLYWIISDLFVGLGLTERNKIKPYQEPPVPVKPKIGGTVVVEPKRNTKAYDVLTLRADLKGFTVEEGSGAAYQWGFVEKDGGLQEIEGAGNQCCCDRETGLGKKIRCEVTLKDVVVWGEFGPLTEEDFLIPLQGKVSIQAIVSQKTAHQGGVALFASYKRRNVDTAPIYTWISGDQEICAGTDNVLPVSRGEVSQFFICQISHPARGGVVTSKPYVLTAEVFDELESKLTKRSAKAAAEQPSPAPVLAEPAKRDLHTELSTKQKVRTTTEPPMESRPAAPEMTLAEKSSLVDAPAKPLEVRVPNFHFFDSNLSRLHYFVASRTDCYATNALEYVDYNTFLNILLKEQGYQYVVLVGTFGEDGGSGCPVTTFGDPSQVPFPNLTAQDGQKHLSAEDVEAFITGEISAALRSDGVKTAIVLPQELLMERGALTARAAQSLRSHIDHPGNSILVVTADQEEDLCHLLDGYNAEFYRMVDWSIDHTLSSFQNASVMVACDAFVEELSRDGRILTAAGAPGRDEIANLLFAMKIEQPERFAQLPYGKVYALSEFLSIRCSSSAGTKRALPGVRNNTWYIGALRNLERALRDDSVLEELIRISASLWGRVILPAASLPSTCLERIYAGIGNGTAPMHRDQISAQERASQRNVVSQKLGQLAGLSSVKRRLNTRLAIAGDGAEPRPGHYIFSGDPGTGKTTVARLMGELLRSRNLLAKGHVVEVSRRDLVADYPGGSRVKTRKKCEEALDGVLFLDGAHQLTVADDVPFSKTHQYNKEAYAALLAFMEACPSRICVICVGSPDEMEDFRIALPGMSEQIPRQNVIPFPDYTEDELYQILLALIRQNGFAMDDGFRTSAKAALLRMKKEQDADFENAHGVRGFLADCWGNALSRAAEHHLSAQILTAEDIPAEYRSMNASSIDSSHLGTVPLVTAEWPCTLIPKSAIPMPTGPRKNIDAESFLPSILRIETEYGSATAFIISPDGYALTCAHAVAQKDNLTNLAMSKLNAYRWPDGIRPIPFRIPNVRIDLDLALLKIETKFELPYLSLAPEGYKIRLKELCTLYGYPKGQERPRVFTGRVSSLPESGRSGELGDVCYLDITGKIGNSGSPVIAESDSYVIGIFRGAHDDENYMKPIHYFWKEFIK